MTHLEKVAALEGAIPSDDEKPKYEDVSEAPPKAPILCLGMPRTGTLSLMNALKILGYPNTHHGWVASESPSLQWQWPILDRANAATFPNLPTFRGAPFSRAEWDEVFGGYDAVSDIASFYAESLIPTYPDAKVILVERDIDAWYKSIVPVIGGSASPRVRRFSVALGEMAGYTSASACHGMQQGWTRSASPNDIVKNLKSAYARHYKFVREVVPEGQLLDYKMGDGWEPLCEFLGKEVPDVPFPHVNDAKEYKARRNRLVRKAMASAVRNVVCPCLGKC